MALGGDQGGSIRIPASCCGIVGLKPTYGLVPYTGIGSMEYSLDSVGPMAKNVKDCALLLQVGNFLISKIQCIISGIISNVSNPYIHSSILL